VLRNLVIGLKESVDSKNAAFQECDSSALSQAAQPVSGSMPMERTKGARFFAKPREASRIAAARTRRSFGETRKIYKP
jgi:hypothetical protein